MWDPRESRTLPLELFIRVKEGGREKAEGGGGLEVDITGRLDACLAAFD